MFKKEKNLQYEIAPVKDSQKVLKKQFRHQRVDEQPIATIEQFFKVYFETAHDSFSKLWKRKPATIWPSTDCFITLELFATPAWLYKCKSPTILYFFKFKIEQGNSFN